MAKRYPLDIVISATDKAGGTISRVAANIEKINAPMGRVIKAFGRFADENQTGFARVGRAMQSVKSTSVAMGKTIATAAVAAAGAVTMLGIKALGTASRIKDAASRINISTDALQAYQYGFEQAGVSQDTFLAGMDRLNRRLGLAKLDQGPAVPFFRGLGIDPKQFKTVEDLLPVLADRLSRVKDHTVALAAASRILGDNEGKLMLEAMQGGSAAMLAMRKDAERVGAVIRNDVIMDIDAMGPAMARVRATFQGIATNAIGRMFPALVKMADAIQRALIDNMPKIEAFAQTFADRLPVYLERTRDAFVAVRDVVSPVIDLITRLFDRFGTGNVVLTALAAVIGGKLIAALASLGVALTGLGVKMAVAFGVPGLIIAGIAAAVAAGWWLYKNFDDVWIKVVDGMEWLVTRFKGAWDTIKTMALDAFGAIRNAMETVFKYSPIGLMLRAGDWAKGKLFGDDASAPIAAAPAIGTSLTQPGAGARQQVEVRVDLSNLPAGTRADASATDGIEFNLSRGYAMPGFN